MNIHSKFHDYYDGVVAQYRDDTIHWNRKEDRVPVPEVPTIVKEWVRSRLSQWSNLMRVRVDYVTDAIGVCGKYYPMLRIIKTGEPTQYIYDKEKILDVLDGLVDARGSYFNRMRKGIRNKRAHILTQLSDLRDDQLFIDAKSPILYVKGNVSDSKFILIKDANLSNIEFYKCVDSWQMMTELSAYFGTVLTKADDIPEPDNKTKIVSAGFDLKSSFRKSPESK